MDNGTVNTERKGSQRIGIGEVVLAFLSKKSAYGGSVQSTGSSLYSYLYQVGEWKDGCILIPKDIDQQTRTTRKHGNMLRVMAAAQGIQTK